MRRYRSLSAMRKRLIELILERSFRFTEEPTFRLASGKMSNFYFNCKPATLSPEGMNLIGSLMFEMIAGEEAWKARAVGGLTLGADPVANAIAYTSYIKGTPLESFVVRKEPKKHGTMLWIEGHVGSGDRVVVIEDVITTGGSAKKAIERARECGLVPVAVLVLIDRQEGGKEEIEAMGVPVKVLLTKDEIFGIYKKSHTILKT